ncbi:MAG: hypothetical protein D6775_16015 [Caldilineae bacterium]|nr:MAG: hypothetical protein D6775_16015 [Caldilineae bacterium]
MSRTQSLRLLLLLALLSLLLTWPLLPHILTHVPGDGIDDPALAWNLWWAKESWVDRAGEGGLFHNPFVGDVMFYPVGINLAFYTLTLWNGALSVPLQSAFNLVLTNNLLLLASFVLSGLGAYLLALEILAWGMAGVNEHESRQTRDRVAAVFAALLYAFASAKLFYASLGQFNIASSQWLPFVGLYLLRSLRPDAGPRDGFMLGLFLLFQTWAELTFGTFAVMLIALVVLAMLATAAIQGQYRSTAARLLLNAVIAGIMFVVGLAPFLANMVPDMLAEGDFLVEGGGFADIFSVDLLGLFFPTQLHPLLGGIIRALSDNSALRPDRSQFMVNKGQHLYLGYVVMALTAYGLWQNRRRLWVWGVAALTGFFFLLSLGPVVRINGYETGIPGLFPLLLRIPFFQANRYPSRYSVMILLGTALLLALGIAGLWTRLRAGWRGRAVWLLALLLLFEHLSIPLPLSDFRLPPVYRSVVADNRPGAILDLPVGWRNGFNVFGKSDTIIMYTQWYQTFHGKPRLGGNTSRNPEHKFQYFMAHPVIGVLAALQDGRPVPDEDWALAQSLAGDLLRVLNIHVVTLHKDKVPPDFEERLLQLFPLEKVEESGGVARYEARWPEERKVVNLSADAPELRTYLRQGWGVVNKAADPTQDPPAWLWATRARPSLVVPGSSKPARLQLNLFVPTRQTLVFYLDDAFLERVSLQPGRNEVALALPPAGDGFPRLLEIRAERTFAPPDIHLASRRIGTTPVESPVHIVVRSAGKVTGDFGHIYVDGREVSPNRRGYNLAAIDPASGELLAAASFDTHAPYLQGESARLATWIEDLPPGTIVAGAVRDAAALSLGDDAVRALQQVGVQNDIRGSLRRAHAFVGVKGMAPGTAAEAVSDLWPVSVVVGDGLTEVHPTFALLALGWVLEDGPQS